MINYNLILITLWLLNTCPLGFHSNLLGHLTVRSSMGISFLVPTIPLCVMCPLPSPPFFLSFSTRPSSLPPPFSTFSLPSLLPFHPPSHSLPFSCLPLLPFPLHPLLHSPLPLSLPSPSLHSLLGGKKEERAREIWMGQQRLGKPYKHLGLYTYLGPLGLGQK